MQPKRRKMSAAAITANQLPTTSAQAIGAFIKAKRLESGQSEEAVCCYLGLSSVRQLRAYETGEESIPLNQVYALSNCLNIPPDEIMELLHHVTER